MPVTVEAVIDAPPLSPPPNGLVLNANGPIDHDDDRFIGGLSLNPENMDRAITRDPCDFNAVSDTARNRPGPLTFRAFVVEAYDECSVFGFRRADYNGRALRALAARETTAIENEFATGAQVPDNPHFEDDGVTAELTTTAVGLRTGLDMAVQAIADNNLGVGMIHARPGLVNAWGSQYFVQYRNNRVVTVAGHLVVPGSGYTGNAPDGTAPSASSEWIYVTDVVQVHRGAVETFLPGEIGMENVDRTNNLVTVRAQRPYAIVGNVPAFWGIQIDPSKTT